MKTVLNTVLDPNRRGTDAKEFDNALRRRIVGQDQALEKVAEIYQMFLADRIRKDARGGRNGGSAFWRRARLHQD
jgi:hypothetical protein